jgi:N-acetylmuramoyl-L-alanine amidase
LSVNSGGDEIPGAFRDAAPVGSGPYEVRESECLQSIAARHGHLWKTIWNHGGNAEVKSARKDPMVILPGDRLEIPEIDPGGVSKAQEKRHRFRRRGVPAVLKLQLQRDGEPRKDEPWWLEIDGQRSEGRTDGEGRIKVPIPPGARSGELRVGEGEHETAHTLDLGMLAPFDTVRGTQQRLRNLGFYEGPPDGKWTEGLKHAIGSFLSTNDFKAEDELSESTLKKIRDAHGS